ncbi:MAG: hypothetical protein AAB676_10025 [Verrucomicrobiota bacterium]
MARLPVWGYCCASFTPVMSQANTTVPIRASTAAILCASPPNRPPVLLVPKGVLMPVQCPCVTRTAGDLPGADFAVGR